MGSIVKTRVLRVGGMTCVSCQNKIEKKLKNTAGIISAEVSYNEGTANVTYDTDIISYKTIVGVIENLDYMVLTDQDKKGTDASRITGILLIIAALYMVIENTGLLTLLTPGQLADQTMSYGMLFVIGLITSVHCVAMCGGINLSQCIPYTAGDSTEKGRLSALRPTFLYNLGRVLSYTVIGFVVGALGSVFTFSTTLQGILKLIAGLFMVIMGINMLGIFPWLRKLNPRMPGFLAKRVYKEKAKSNSPLFVGLLNGFMPCGPLQAMQIYALSTGNPFSGALSMLLFSLGTVPLMFGLGALSTVLGKKFAGKIMTAGAVLVVVLGLSMVTQGFSLSGVSVPNLAFVQEKDNGAGQENQPAQKIEDGVQIINSTLSSGKYPNIKVQAGIPVKWIIDAPKGSINGCNNRMIIRDFGIEHTFQTGENIIEFTPEKTGKVSYSCWMGMIRGTISITEEAAGTGTIENEAENLLDKPVPAGVTIPTDDVAIGEESVDENGNPIQKITMELTDKGFQPAAAVVKSGLDVEWNIIDSTTGNNYGTTILVPDFATQVPLEPGDNRLYFTPAGSFDFSNGDNTSYGYIKVVDDISKMDLNEIKKEIGNFQTQIWPDTTFQGAGGSCCQ